MVGWRERVEGGSEGRGGEERRGEERRGEERKGERRWKEERGGQGRGEEREGERGEEERRRRKRRGEEKGKREQEGRMEKADFMQPIGNQSLSRTKSLALSRKLCTPPSQVQSSLKYTKHRGVSSLN